MEEERFVYRNENHDMNLNNMRLNNKWCDVTIIVNKKKFRAHKVILSANLKYFDTMFSNDAFRESNQDVIPMQDVREADLEAFICYAYTGEVLLTDSNVLDLLEFANYLGEEDIKDACIDFLEKHLKADYACRAYKFADVVGSFSLKNVAKRTIISNFDTCSQTSEYLNFDCEQLMDILVHEKLQFDESQKLFEGIMMWITYDMKKRRNFMKDLLNCINLKKLTADNLVYYLFNNVVDFKDEYNIVRDVMVYYYTNKTQQVKNQTLMLIGWNKKGLNYQFCDVINKQWSVLEEIPDNYDTVYSMNAVLDNGIYYVGENSQGVYLNEFHAATKQNSVLQSSDNILRWCTLCTCDRYVYLCGGKYQNNTSSHQVLKYDPLTNSFIRLPPMPTKRNGAAAIVYQDCLHVLGGWSRRSRINLVDKYDPETKEWMNFPSMCESRSGHAVAILNDKLYACGGFEKNSVEVYDPFTESWQLVASMNRARDEFLVVAHEGKLVAIGGHNGDRTVEVYDPNENVWQMDYVLSSGLQIWFPSGGWISTS